MPEAFPQRLDVVDDVMARILSQKTDAERLAMTHRMWSHARRMLLSVIRSEHSDWSDEQVAREAARRLSHGAA